VGRAVDVTLKRPEVAEDLPTVDCRLRHQTGLPPRLASSCATARPRAAASSASSTGACRR
jgi:hypothetical protein